MLDFLLRLADNDLILSQRLAEWVGKGPILEEDIASANVGLDLLGQSRMWFAYASEVESAASGTLRDEDQFAFRRDAHEFRNLLLCELPNGTYAHTIARQFLFDHWHRQMLDALSRSTDVRIAEIATKAAKEVAYHVERSSDWVIRLGDGTGESQRRMQGALDELWSYTSEMFLPEPADAELLAGGVAPDPTALRGPWIAGVDAVLAEATLARPAEGYVRRGGRQGMHTEHLGRLLAEMQFLQRAYPDARW